MRARLWSAAVLVLVVGWLLPTSLWAQDRPYLGVYLDRNADEARVEKVAKNGPAAKAGIKVGDIIRAADGRSIREPAHLGAVLSKKRPGDVIELRVERDGWERAFEVVLGRRKSKKSAPEKGSLGIYLLEKDGSLIVEDTTAGGPADKAGIQEGDVIKMVKIGSRRPLYPVENFDQLARYMKDARPGQKATLLIERDGWSRNFDLKLTARKGSESETEEEYEEEEEEVTPSGRGYLGIFVEETDNGLVISEVADDSPAEVAGLKVGDRLISIQGRDGKVRKVRTIDALARNLAGASPGDPFVLEIERKKWHKYIQVTLGHRPEEMPDEPESSESVVKPGKGWLGILVEETDDGLKVVEAKRRGPAHGRLKVGQIITGVELIDGSQPVSSPVTIQKLGRFLRGKGPGTKVRFELSNGASVVVTLARRPSDDSGEEEEEEERQPVPRDERGFMGVNLEPTDNGVRIAQLFQGTPAAKSGLKRGDVIVRLKLRGVGEAETPLTVETLLEVLQYGRPGDRIAVRVRRNGGQKTFRFKLGERPSNPQPVPEEEEEESEEGEPPYLGVSVSVDAEGNGLKIEEVKNGGPADKAGLAVGDRILKFAGKTVGSIPDLATALRGHYAGDTVSVVILRDGKKKKIRLELGAR